MWALASVPCLWRFQMKGCGALPASPEMVTGAFLLLWSVCIGGAVGPSLCPRANLTWPCVPSFPRAAAFCWLIFHQILIQKIFIRDDTADFLVVSSSDMGIRIMPASECVWKCSLRMFGCLGGLAGSPVELLAEALLAGQLLCEGLPLAVGCWGSRVLLVQSGGR